MEQDGESGAERSSNTLAQSSQPASLASATRAGSAGTTETSAERHAQPSQHQRRVSIADDPRLHAPRPPKEARSQTLTHTGSGSNRNTGSRRSSCVSASRRTSWVVAQEVYKAVSFTTALKTLRDTETAEIDYLTDLRHEATIGEGAFGIVERCMYLPKQRPVAVKKLKFHEKLTSADIQDMMREIALMKKMRNPNIVEYIGSGIYIDSLGNKVHFLVEEFIDGGTLKAMVTQCIKTGKRIYSMQDGVRWLADVAKGLQYLHESIPKVIHRDMKLDNVLLKGTDPHTSRAVICDLGLSTLIRPAQILPPGVTSSPQGRNSMRRTSISRTSIEGRPSVQGSGGRSHSPHLAPGAPTGRPSMQASGRLPGHGAQAHGEQAPPQPYYWGPAAGHPAHAHQQQQQQQYWDQPQHPNQPHPAYGVPGQGVVLAPAAPGQGRNRRTSTVMVEEWAQHARARTETKLKDKKPKVGPLKVHNEGERLEGRIGTWLYMAPEVYRQEVYCEKADVFSFGVICYEVLHRYRMSLAVANAEEAQVYARRVATKDFRPPMEELLPKEFQFIIRQCWHADAKARPSMATVVKMLQDAAKTADWTAFDKAELDREREAAGCLSGCSIM